MSRVLMERAMARGKISICHRSKAVVPGRRIAEGVQVLDWIAKQMLQHTTRTVRTSRSKGTV